MSKHKSSKIRIYREMPKCLGKLMQEKVRQSGRLITLQQEKLRREIGEQEKTYSRHNLTKQTKG